MLPKGYMDILYESYGLCPIDTHVVYVLLYGLLDGLQL